MATTETVDGAGVPLACRIHGDAAARRAVLLVHDLAADARGWDDVAAAVARRGARAIAYDRRGYGASDAPEPYERTTVQEQAQDARAVLAAHAGDEGTWACGAGFGALIVLDLLVRAPGLLAGAVLLEPPVHQLSLTATEALSHARAELERALAEGGPEAAVAWWRPEADAAVRAAHRAFFADYGGLASWPVTRRELRAIAVPLIVATAPGSAPHLIEEADALAALVPGAERARDGDVAAALARLLDGAA